MAPSIVLSGETDFAGFRRQARALLAQGVAPDDVQVRIAGAAPAELFEGTSAATTAPPAFPAPPLSLPAALLHAFEQAAMHADPSRWRLMLGLLWRLQHEPALRHDPADPQRIVLERMARHVQREQHKMKAFVRFREVARDGAGSKPLHVAWFEPAHRVVQATAPFFVRRFANLEWAILTPECSVHWDGVELRFGAGAQRDAAPPADAGEALWLTYYESVFNPARLKLATMAREMPRRFWPNLPESVAIPALAAQAHARAGRMVEQPPKPLRRRIPVAPVDEAGHGAPPAHALGALRRAAASCRDCPLGAPATQTVFGEGAADAALMLVGEQPGDQEDLQGRPFVGPAGQLLARALAELGWPREALYITNAVKHFKFEPRGKRRLHKTPSQREAAACLQWLQAEIDAVRPRALVALGATAARQLLGRELSVTRERGHWLRRDDGRPVLVTLHPSALLRMEPEQREAAYAQWLDDLRIASPDAVETAARP